VNDRQEIARDQSVAYIRDRWPRYWLTPEGEAVLAEHAARLDAMTRREVRRCACGKALRWGQARFCSLRCFRSAQ
jgi:hypothetical protein